jgi:hypothetical protein
LYLKIRSGLVHGSGVTNDFVSILEMVPLFGTNCEKGAPIDDWCHTNWCQNEYFCLIGARNKVFFFAPIMKMMH